MQYRKLLISRGCSWVLLQRGGCTFVKKGGFAVGTQPQRVSALPPLGVHVYRSILTVCPR